jgi:phosphoribosylanthranilate isomerase
VCKEMIVKICGITNLQDALFAEEQGADMLGFVFAESPRQVGSEVGGIIAGLAGDAAKVGVFVDEPVEKVIGLREELGLDYVQLHGSEDADYCQRLMPGVIKLIRVSAGFKAEQLADFPADYYLLEGEKRAVAGGSGVTFDWSAAAELKNDQRVIVSGGLKPENVAGAIAELCPGGVDVSSGVEASPGNKDQDRVAQFIKAARATEN